MFIRGTIITIIGDFKVISTRAHKLKKVISRGGHCTNKVICLMALRNILATLCNFESAFSTFRLVIETNFEPVLVVSNTNHIEENVDSHTFMDIF